MEKKPSAIRYNMREDGALEKTTATRKFSEGLYYTEYRTYRNGKLRQIYVREGRGKLRISGFHDEASARGFHTRALKFELDFTLRAVKKLREQIALDRKLRKT